MEYSISDQAKILASANIWFSVNFKLNTETFNTENIKKYVKLPIYDNRIKIHTRIEKKKIGVIYLFDPTFDQPNNSF